MTIKKPNLIRPATLRRMVEELVSTSKKPGSIARVIGCTEAELRRLFSTELRDGHAKRRAEIVGLLFEQARSRRNVAADAASSSSQ